MEKGKERIREGRRGGGGTRGWREDEVGKKGAERSFSISSIMCRL